MFVENLPGYPANVRSSKDGGYWLGLIAIRKWPFAFLDFVGPYPFLRRLLTKVSMTYFVSFHVSLVPSVVLFERRSVQEILIIHEGQLPFSLDHTERFEKCQKNGGCTNNLFQQVPCR